MQGSGVGAGKTTTILVTGANGDVGRAVTTTLRKRYRLRLAIWELGREGPAPSYPPEAETVQVDIRDLAALSGAVSGVDAIVHLAGQRSFHADWDELRGPNIDGVYNVLAAARARGVPKVILASSNHATGYLDEHQQWPIGEGEPPRADSLYGVTKAFAEIIGRYAADYWDLSVICLRIGWVLDRPHNEMALRMWLSPGDLGRLVVGAIETGKRFGVYYGVSANQRRQWDISGARHDLGYEPQDDSEVFAAHVGL
jgi:NAD+ dependent glucose-6-phosphate dehydrogenase